MEWTFTNASKLRNLPTNCLSVFDHFVKLALKGLNNVKDSLCLFTSRHLLLLSFAGKFQKSSKRLYIFSVVPTTLLMWLNAMSREACLYACPEMLSHSVTTHFLANVYLFRINNRNTSKSVYKCVKCSKLIIKNPGPSHWRRSCVFIVNFEYISHLFLMSPLLSLNK